IDITETICQSKLDVGFGSGDAKSIGDDIRSHVQSNLMELLKRGRRWDSIEDRSPNLIRLSFRRRDIEKVGKRLFGLRVLLLGVEQADLGGIEQNLDASHIGSC